MSKYNSVHLLIVDFVDTTVLSSVACKYEFAYFVSFFITTVRPLLSGHPRDFEKWPLNRGTI